MNELSKWYENLREEKSPKISTEELEALYDSVIDLDGPVDIAFMSIDSYESLCEKFPNFKSAYRATVITDENGWYYKLERMAGK